MVLSKSSRTAGIRSQNHQQVSHEIGVFTVFSDEKWTLFQSEKLTNYPGFVCISFLHYPRVNRYKNIFEKICQNIFWVDFRSGSRHSRGGPQLSSAFLGTFLELSRNFVPIFEKFVKRRYTWIPGSLTNSNYRESYGHLKKMSANWHFSICSSTTNGVTNCSGGIDCFLTISRFCKHVFGRHGFQGKLWNV